MPRIIRNLVLFMMVTALSVSAQSRQGIVRISPFTGSGIPASELATLERLVASHVAELRLFRVIDDAGRELALGETEIALSLGYQSNTSMPLAADIILSGHLGRIGDLYVFTLENTRVSSGEKISVSDTGFSINDVVLRTRSLTRNLFGRAEETASSQPGGSTQASSHGTLPSPEARPAEPVTSDNPAMVALPDNNYILTPSLAQIAGTWRGDRGLETVRLFPNGTGMAVLSGGGSMRLRISLEADAVVVSQDQANDAAMYRSPNISFDIATRIASLARPMKWRFRLSTNGQTLEGVKESVLVSGTSTALTVDNDYVREAVWSRISR
jgi:hypothetical protein